MIPFQPFGAADRALNAFNKLSGIGSRDFGIFGISFIGSAPSVITHNGDGRCKCPFLRANPDFLRRNFSNLAKQFWIAGRPEPNIVRKNGRAGNVIVAMHGIRAPNHRNKWHAVSIGLLRRLIKFIRESDPIRSRRPVIAIGRRITAIKNGA